MKNIIIIDIDTERTPMVQFGKPNASSLPKNADEAKEVIIRDMACLCEALSTLIQVANNSGYKITSESVNDCIIHLQRNLETDKID